MTTTTVTTGTLEHIDPAMLVIEANVRTSAPVTAEFVASIRANGVLTPVLARRDEHDNVIVRAGQRRTLAAREAGTPTIPVYVIDADERTTDRIVQQIVENDQRTALSTAERTAAWAQLAFEGITAATIAKRTGVQTRTVRQGLAVAESATVTSALHEHPLTLDQAAILLEFEDDDDARTALIEVAQSDSGQFDHQVQMHRDEKARRVRLTAAEEDHIARGFRLLTRSEAYADDGAWTPIRSLRTADGDSVTVDHIAALDGRAAHVALDWRTEPQPTYFVQDPGAAGFVPVYGTSLSQPEEDSEEEQAAKKAQRRILLANNKAWTAAETIRRQWITTFLTRKTLPKDTDRAIADGLTLHRSAVAHALSGGNPLAHTLLGIEQPVGHLADSITSHLDAHPARARLISLAIVLAGTEAAITRDAWRYGDSRAAAHFSRLAAWGYTLAPVEQIVTGDTTPAEAAGLA